VRFIKKGSGFRVEDVGLHPRYRVRGSGFGVQGSGFRVEDVGLHPRYRVQAIVVEE